MKIIKWEMNEPIRVLILLVGMVLNASVIHNALLSLHSSIVTINFQARLDYRYLMQEASTFSTTFALSNLLRYPGFWMISIIFISLLGAIIFRADRDSGYASSLYSLPYRKWEMFIVKYITLITFSCLLIFIPLFSVTLFANFSLARELIDIFLSQPIKSRLLALTYMLLYTTSVVSVVSLVSVSVLISFIVSFTLLLLPFYLGISNIPPLLFLYAEGREVTSQDLMVWGIILPISLVIIGIIISERRDVK
ncbi:hypothetical protein [Pyrococcus sp. ST04]|uniref:hypothetical protein n=1 Tax=Pyrococcus sp. ST04 TaxID=1183377 RepID=UPI0002605C30|nr:hypothetical protein [Pyrococcus sp. ST04]AFK22356.1 hypothetical protein Py04_0755 [Pyrococcus sp. ST04]